MQDIKNTLWAQKAQKKVKRVVAYKRLLSELSDDQLKNKTSEFRDRYIKGESLDSMLPEAFATVREASRRVTGMEHYPVQILSGIALHEGKIAEQKTGEGKTLVAALPSYLNAIPGKGVHIVTVNDYLAKRDATLIGKIHEYLGLSVGVVLSDMSIEQRKQAYGCDITYVTNSELGFDYLRDNMATSTEFEVQRGLNYAIIDEVDSILIDEARTPLIISGGGYDVSKLYTACNAVVKKLTKGEYKKEFNRIEAMFGDSTEESGDFVVHEKEKTISLTKSGISKIEAAFGLSNYSDPQNVNLCHAINQCLYANNLMKKDKDYIVKDGEVQIVDTFTGRIMDGHQFSDGLHQAIEAKERVPIRKESRTLATITYQRFFHKYKKICGMTGTAYSQKEEFKATYGINTVVIPTNKKVIRRDHKDRFYCTKKEKYQAVINEVNQSYRKGQPVLIGTASIKTSEEIDYLLSMEDIPHQVLNAKQDEREAEIIAKAGIHGTVTVATNMAGRGTDIILDKEAKEAGGLKVIGTELHDSIRIDNQLRGRAGRQGDPGESVFFISSEDRIIRMFAGDSLKILLKDKSQNGLPLKNPIYNHYAKHAQKTVEDNHYGTRKDVLEYDIINDHQRELIYKARRAVLRCESQDKIDQIYQYSIDKLIKMLLDEYGFTADLVCKLNGRFSDWLTVSENNDNSRGKVSVVIIDSKYGNCICRSKKELSSFLETIFKMRYVELQINLIKAKKILLTGIDISWMEQIRALECLRQGIGYQGYAQIDPKTAYAESAFDLFNKMQLSIYTYAISTILGGNKNE